MPRRLLCVLAIVLVVCLPAALPAKTIAASAPSDAVLTARRMEMLRAHPDRLLAFFAAMPKGADLHNHADGSVYAEDLLAWAIADGACYVPATFVLDERCGTGSVPLATGIASDANLAASIVRALSMETFAPHGESGHDHFFNTFGKFSSVAAKHPDRVLAAATADAARDGVSYLELMTALDVGESFAAAHDAGVAHPFDPVNLAADDAALDAPFVVLGPKAIADAHTVQTAMRTDLGCDGAMPDPGCRVTVRYIDSVLRALPPPVVFAQTRLAFELANAAGTNFVAINYVAPEDDPVAVRDYALHMRFVAYFHRKYPHVAITLHAGEITPALAAPATLSDHIRQAIEVASATRIGHGVDVLGERDAAGLLREMARKRVLVEIALTSNDVILNVRGNAHPLPAYLAAGVPVALVTDDAGVSRSDFNHEFLRAAQTYGFGYAQLKTFARNSVHDGFMGGASLWTDDRYTAFVPACAHGLDAPSCSAYRDANLRAAEEWKLERALRTFEHTEATSRAG
jgi:adenosine deaminase